MLVLELESQMQLLFGRLPSCKHFRESGAKSWPPVLLQHCPPICCQGRYQSQLEEPWEFKRLTIDWCLLSNGALVFRFWLGFTFNMRAYATIGVRPER